jgi:hypothetical protein
MSVRSWLPNALGFQLVWLASVGGAAYGWWWAGPAALIPFAIWQIATSRWPRADLLLMCAAAGAGFAIDSVWTQSGLMQFASPSPSPAWAPVWIVAMWMGFALTLNHSLAALKTHPRIAFAFGLLGGPLAYWIADSAWNAVDIVPGATAYVALGIAWAVATPLMLYAAERLIAGAPLPRAA